MAEDATNTIVEAMMKKDKKNIKNDDEDQVESILNHKGMSDQSSKAFNLMDNLGGIFTKWSNKTDILSQSKNKNQKSRITEAIDPSLMSGQTFVSEALERQSKVVSGTGKLSEDFLSRQFRGSYIFSENDKQEGKVKSFSSDALHEHTGDRNEHS